MRELNYWNNYNHFAIASILLTNFGSKSILQRNGMHLSHESFVGSNATSEVILDITNGEISDLHVENYKSFNKHGKICSSPNLIIVRRLYIEKELTSTYKLK